MAKIMQAIIRPHYAGGDAWQAGEATRVNGAKSIREALAQIAEFQGVTPSRERGLDGKTYDQKGPIYRYSPPGNGDCYFMLWVAAAEQTDTQRRPIRAGVTPTLVGRMLPGGVMEVTPCR